MPAPLQLAVAPGSPQGFTTVLTSAALVGSADQCDVRIPIPVVGQRHLVIAPGGAGWTVTDVGSPTGTLLRSAALQPGVPAALSPGDVLTLGGPGGVPLQVSAAQRPAGAPTPPHVPTPAVAPQEIPGFSSETIRQVARTRSEGVVVRISAVSLVYHVPRQPVQPAPGFLLVDPDDIFDTKGVGKTLTVGRTAEADVVITDRTVANRHATITRTNSGFKVHDYGSANGTYVNGLRISDREVKTGDMVSFGKIFFEVVAQGLRVWSPTASQVLPALVARDVTFSVPDRNSPGNRKRLLAGIDFEVPDRSVVAVVGPSGAGKSTFIRTVLGRAKPDTGFVTYDGLDVNAYHEALQDDIGYVPQDDLVHGDLTARQVLQYAAKLRFSKDVDAAGRAHAVDWAMAMLGIREHGDTQVKRMSGGQRKRVSTAIELLTRPSLLVLDEPTSGLDPALDRQVMALLKDIAHGTPANNDGRIAVVVTHSIANLDMADYVLLLAPGGIQAFFGRPQEVLDHFQEFRNSPNPWAEIFSWVSANPVEAGDRFRQMGPKGRRRIQAPAPPNQGHAPILQIRTGGVRDLFTLSGRALRIMFTDLKFVAVTLGLPIGIGAMTAMIKGDRGLLGSVDGYYIAEPIQILAIVLMAALLMGIVPSTKELVAERAIFRREALTGTGVGAYLGSKILVQTIVLAFQSALLTAVVLLINPHPNWGVGAPYWIELWFAILLIALAGSAVGYIISATAKSLSGSLTSMIMALVALVVLSGSILSLGSGLAGSISYASPSRWGFGSLAASSDLNVTVREAGYVLPLQKGAEQVDAAIGQYAQLYGIDPAMIPSSADQPITVPDYVYEGTWDRSIRQQSINYSIQIVMLAGLFTTTGYLLRRSLRQMV